MYTNIFKTTLIIFLLATITGCANPRVKSALGTAALGALIGSATDSETAQKGALAGAAVGAGLGGFGLLGGL